MNHTATRPAPHIFADNRHELAYQMQDYLSEAAQVSNASCSTPRGTQKEVEVRLPHEIIVDVTNCREFPHWARLDIEGGDAWAVDAEVQFVELKRVGKTKLAIYEVVT